MSGSFPGGVHPRYEKDLTAGKASRTLDPPAEAVIPLSQHIGAPAKACVEKGDEVKTGQVVGEAGGFVSSPVHATVSGKVKAIDDRPHPSGSDVPSVVITSLSFNRSGNMIASASSDGTIRLWDVASQALTDTLESSEGTVRSVLFLERDDRLAAGGDGGCVDLLRTVRGVVRSKEGGRAAKRGSRRILP